MAVAALTCPSSASHVNLLYNTRNFDPSAYEAPRKRVSHETTNLMTSYVIWKYHFNFSYNLEFAMY